MQDSLGGAGVSANEPHNVELQINRLMSGNNKMIRIPNYAKGPVLCCSIVLCVACVHVDYANAELQFGEPVNLGEAINSPGNEKGPWVSPDARRIVFGRRVGGEDVVPHVEELYEAVRDSSDQPFGAGIELVGTNIGVRNTHPSLTNDGLRMVFAVHANVDVFDNADLYETSRTSFTDAWSNPVPLNINTSTTEGAPTYSNGGLSLAFHARDATGNLDVMVTSRDDFDSPWSEPSSIGSAINTPAIEAQPFLSDDGSLLFFSSNRDGGFGGNDIYYSMVSDAGEWSQPVNLGPSINTEFSENSPFLSADGSEFYYWSNRPSGFLGNDLYVSQVVPEPSTAAMTIWGILFSVGLVRNKRRKGH